MDVHCRGKCCSSGNTAVTLPLRKPTHRGVQNAQGCVEDVCRCTRTRADCSRNYGRLTYVPRLPDSIRTLIFSFNNLTKILRDDFFQNGTRLVSLHLENNGLEYISHGAFRPLTRLEALYLGHNALTYPAIRPVFSANRLSILHLTYMDLGPLPDNWFLEKPAPPIQNLNLSGNQLLQHLNLSVLSRLQKLRYLSVQDSRIFSVTSAYMPKLLTLNLQSNALFDLPESCGNGTGLFPSLQRISLGRNTFSGFHGKICLPRLEFLDLSSNPITVVKTDMFNSHRFPSLKKLRLDAVMSFSMLDQFAFRGPTLRSLSLQFCRIIFRKSVIHPDAFAGIPNLNHLQISHNLGRGIPEEKFNRLFGSLTNLTNLSMDRFELLFISKNMFVNLTSLETLHLYGNRISEIPDGIFDSLENLKYLCLSHNQIQVILETTFSAATRKQLRHLDINDNPLVCDCDNLWFQSWFASSPALFAKHYRDYHCKNMNNMPLISFTMNKQACVLSPQTSKVLIACVAFFLFVLLLASVVFQYRWHIRLMLAFRGHSEIMRRRLMEEHFTYDVFLSCAEEDEDWVLQHLLPHLESGQGLRACFHKRDFLPGKNILDNIVDSVKSSKKFVLVFSQHFALSRWCQFELDLCLGHALDNDDALVVILLEDASSRDLTSTMTAVLTTTTYVQWQECPDMRSSFWRRLGLSLAELRP
ncbi:toll-like receptor 4 isoform X2 [Babylonia areolata]|uniref:toll-like receptor 4 isoform X2 n=1 Tax=Babylonia areolata TaxID=304850 RepID=UPI003FD560C7